MNNTPLDEIRKALDAASAPLHAEQEPWPGNDNLQYWVGDHYDGIGAFVKYEDAYLAANAPVWLRSLLEENERMRLEADGRYLFDKERIIRLESELEQVKKERDKALAYPTEWAYEQACKALEKNRADAESLRSQLAAKDKVLEWYADCDAAVFGKKARSILEQYARSAIVPNE